MTRKDVIEQARSYLALAADLVADYVEGHPSESLQTLCKEIDPDNWNALRNRVQRAQARRESLGDNDNGRSSTRDWRAEEIRRSVTAAPDEVAQSLTQMQRIELVNALEKEIKSEAPKRKVYERGGLDAAATAVAVGSAIAELRKEQPGWCADVRTGAITSEIADKAVGDLSIIVDLMAIAASGEVLSVEELLK